VIKAPFREGAHTNPRMVKNDAIMRDIHWYPAPASIQRHSGEMCGLIRDTGEFSHVAFPAIGIVESFTHHRAAALASAESTAFRTTWLL
jgi:hypothetical protein